mmetsp:Transcript_69771/g.177058  ORF Transcript_69771/g.177058 Transcript_69771/m.177058 type:complete len:243 (-) Transcript_69771:71-799(-)
MLPLAAFLHAAVAGWTFGNQVLLPSEWSRLLPLAERVFGISLPEYLVVTEAYRMGMIDGVTMDFMRARFLDFSRTGSWLLMLVFLACCTYYIVYCLWALVLRPFLMPFAFLAKELCIKCVRNCGAFCGWSLPDMAEHVSLSWDEAEVEMRVHGVTSSYRLADNKNYQAAYKALQHTAELLKSQGSMAPKPRRCLSTPSSAPSSAAPSPRREQGSVADAVSKSNCSGGENLNSFQVKCRKAEQ